MQKKKTGRVLHFQLFFFLFISFYNFVFAIEEDFCNTGSLLVTYQTGPKAERLDRIRFWLKDDKNKIEIYPKSKAYVDDLTCMTRLVVIEDLKPGRYVIQFVVPNYDKLFDQLPPRVVNIIPNKIIKIDQTIKPHYASIKVITTVKPAGEMFDTAPTVTLRDHTGLIQAQSTIGKFVNHHLLPGKYILSFEAISGFQNPEPFPLVVGANQNLGPIEGIYTKINQGETDVALAEISKSTKLGLEDIQKTVLVKAGLVIMGDPFDESKINELPSKKVKIKEFYIGTYEVTNAQYALWLNKAWSEGKITSHTQSELRGQITNKEGRLLCKTLEGDANSQIYIHSTSEGPHFLPMVGKHNFPVINVSWFGADAYCKDYQFRLPTEAEWEKAAGMENDVLSGSVKKYRYGFGQDTIDKSWANYKDSSKKQEHFQILTTKVGYYNGINKLPKNGDEQTEITTHLAQSPSGAFDMSGNVWEWVLDWYDDEYYVNMPEDNPQGPISGNKRTVKGGCYDSLGSGLRVAERIGLPPEHLDPYTGFRVAGDVQ
jgi:formylglycine-generating enzyme required for sulfatase activity